MRIILVLLYLAVAVAVIAGAIGWVLNLVALFTGFADMVIGELLIRLVGIPVAFVGSIMGWCF
ncbi:hypothetical protein [uncultured Agrobacterium sp.]|uniref:hypothetical protein n=1 Tax=uncultured Agrobacterium sp. TaxID=157277 RepID=UPI0025F7746A|nr:hypothetical protein [uncultured Agrobacterium sp.]